MIAIRLMTAADVPAALALCRQAGWNQTAADWQRFLLLEPDGCFLAEEAGTLIGTTTCTVFGPVAWLAMVLVEPSHRGRGIGAALVQHALDYLERRSVKTVRLDATPLGRPLYERLGFVEQFQIARYGGSVADVAPLSPLAGRGAGGEGTGDLRAMAELDMSVTRTDRRRLLERLFAEEPSNLHCVWQDSALTGYLMSRPGALADHIGPCIAAPEAGPLLLTDALRRSRERAVFVDIPVNNEPAKRLVESLGLKTLRHLTRMGRGADVRERLAWLWASSGPEKG
jgi:ribosomal protein S18 acetylase RimI-like enzyme